MAKFRIRLKLQAFELEIDGERGDIPAITSAVQQQFSGLIKPAEAIADGGNSLEGRQVHDSDGAKNKSRANRRRGSKASNEGAGQPVEYRHDSSRYGNPQQSWTLTEKAVWLLAVIKGMTGTKEVSGPDLAATFNGYYKASGKLHPPVVTRELAKAKLQNPALVGEDKQLWYLTDAGEQHAQRLIDTVLNLS